MSFLLGVCNALVGFFYIYAIRITDNIALVTITYAFLLPLTVIASYFLLKERENTKIMWLATGIGCVGLIIVAL